MIFSVKERLVLGVILQKKMFGNVTALKQMRHFREDLSFSKEEFEILEMKEEGGPEGLIRWNQEAEELIKKEIEVNEIIKQMVIRTLQELNRQDQIHEDWLDVFDRFVNPEKS